MLDQNITFDVLGSNQVFVRLAAASMALVFLYSALTKSIYYQDALAEFRDLGLPAVAVALPAVLALQFFGGIALITGIFDRPAAFALAVFTALATAVGHRIASTDRQERIRNRTTILEHLAIVGGLVAFTFRPETVPT